MTKRTPFDKADAYFMRITEGRPVWRGAYLIVLLFGFIACAAALIGAFWIIATDLREIETGEGLSHVLPAMLAYWPLWAFVGGMFAFAFPWDYFSD